MSATDSSLRVGNKKAPITAPSREELFRQSLIANGPETNRVPISMTEDDARAFAAGDATIRGKVDTISATKTYMYFRGVYGWQPRIVSSNSIGELLAVGVLPYCGDCKSNTCCIRSGEGIDETNLIDPNPNACEGKEDVKLRRCPVCRKSVYDYDASKDSDRMVPDDDPNVIQDKEYENASPEVRTKARLDEHIRSFHRTEATMFGIAQPGTPELIRAL